MKRLSTKTQFRVGAAGIIVFFCVVISVSIYYYLRDSVTRNIYRETEIFVATADATRTYVKDVLRPTVIEALPEESFLPQAMSTSFVGREIMSRLQDRFPHFRYRRAADDAMNPINRADDFERGMLEWFRQHPQSSEWHGLIEKNGSAYYTWLRAIYAEQECLACHGRPEQAPQAMKDIYGTSGGFNYRIGDVVAADTIYIPVDVAFVHIKETTWLVSVMAICSLLFLMGLFHLLFNRTIVSELKGLLSTFRGISGKSGPLPELPGSDAHDEFQQVKGAFEKVAADLKQTHEELRASESKYRQLFERSQDAILIINAETRLLDINPGGISLFGFRNREEALSIETGCQLFWDTRDGQFFFETLRRDGFVQGLELSMVDRSGRKIEVMISATVHQSDNGSEGAIEAMCRDVTEKRRMEKYLAQTEKLASIGQLAAGFAHEINNPLGVIKCYANLIGKSLDPESQMESDLRVIQKHTDQCRSVVEALLSFARVPEPKRTATNLHACLDEVLSVLGLQMKKGRIALIREFAEPAPRLIIDAQQIKQVFMNLALNAMQAMPEGGQLTVRTRIHADTRQVEVEFADTGSGIPPDKIDRIFDPFFTTKIDGKGTGLGLSVSYGIVDRHSGRINVTSEPGGGAVFTVWLPTGEKQDGHRQ